MKKGSIVRKLITSSLAFAFTAVCLTSTTYAWFAKNSEAWTEEFMFDIENYDGLSISIDGENFGLSVDNDDIRRAIVAKVLGKNPGEVTDAEVTEEFAKIKLKDVATTDCVNFTALDLDRDSYTDDEEFYKLKEADVYNYVTFDLYFRVTSFGDALGNYDLTFVSDEHSTNSESKVPVSYIKALDSDVRLNYKFTANGVDYKSGDHITVNAENAMRFGVITENNGTIIYEPNAGLGSYAIEGGEGVYDPANNHMLQYLNAYADKDLEPVSAEYKDILTATEKDFNGEKVLGTFTLDENNNYNDVKITVAIWLEGMDADYFAGMDVESIKCFLSFCKKESV